MTDHLVVSRLADISIDLAERVAFAGASVRFSEAALARVAAGRARFERLLARPGSYIYGSTTAPGNRAKQQLDASGTRAQGRTLAEFLVVQPGLGGRWLPARTIRLAILARLANGLSGHGKLSVETLEALRALLDGDPPPVPLDGLTGPGEVMATSWLLAPIADRQLQTGEAMALINGSPFATAFIADVAITACRRVHCAEQVFAMSAEAAGAPLGHFDVRLSDAWPDPNYRAALERIGELLAGGAAERLAHQAPVAWRLIPNILASAIKALADARASAAMALRSVKDNPTFLTSPDQPDDDAIVSSGGYHDHGSCRSIDTVNAIFADLCVLAQRQVARLVSGRELGLPHLLATDAGAAVGTEYLAWTLTQTIARARQAAVPATLDLSLEDPGGNQSDIAEPAFVAYARHLDAARSLDECLATLAVTSTIALDLRGTTIPPLLRPLWQTCQAAGDPDRATSAAAGVMLRQVHERFAAMATGPTLGSAHTTKLAAGTASA